MKNFILLSFLVLQSVLVFAQEQPRVSQLFNFDWKFRAGDLKEAQLVTYDDDDWRVLDLPHDFQIEQTWDESAGGARGFKAMGTGWYRKHFKANPAWKGKRVLLDFEGIMLVGDVWVNGRKVGSTDYGYLGFETDITDLLKYDEDNVVAVWASTGKKDGSRWYTGGGLFRDVHLVIKNPIAIARHGVFVSTPKITEQRAEVSVQVELEGIRNKSLDIEINARILAPDGKTVADTKGKAPQKSKLQTVEVSLPIVTVDSPGLWSCETPNLYTAEVSLVQDGKVIDCVTETFGIRTLEFSPDFGFKLNGKKLFLKGISNHHDLGAVGVAAFDRAIERQFQLMKRFGYNHIRSSHNPYSESFLKLADKYGILVVDELIDKWSDNSYWGGRVPFTQLWYQMIPEWIKRDRNHPSVILWSLGNELQMREDLAGFPTGDWGVTTYRIFDVLVKRYDKTRKTTVAMFPARAGAIGKNEPEFNTKVYPPELATVTEVSSFNYRYLNYAQYLEKCPHMTVYQSEATTNELAAPFFGMDHDKMVGLAYWGAIEYWGESNGWPKKGWNFSFFNHCLEPYPQAYLIKSAFCEEPLVHIGVMDNGKEAIEWNDIMVGSLSLASHWNWTTGCMQNLYTYTNADEVELLVNGKSMGIRKNDRTDITRRNIIYWENIPYGKGGNIIAVARNNGKEVARHRLETTGKATALKMVVENPEDWKADGMDLQYVKVYAVDNKGRVVPDTKDEVTFKVSGAARLIAVDNGDHFTDELFTGNTKKLHKGFIMAILRSDRSGGEVVITASSKGLKDAVKKLVTK
ncbi:glycoside hydrolase family 2 TIM barrel-domain containing protein [Bacteroides sp.]|jgi:glycoside hydrolase family 2, sugar binding|uniref:glycoside hydrolase family 2 TIM barrel-domain containing protein n=1 Tax=Bacteroides TaxID=816 RepID=UPI00258D2C42|nr:glycoside hydrolase family 2 TIM barrel-domain containing protein [Bacteroides sp.]